LPKEKLLVWTDEDEEKCVSPGKNKNKEDEDSVQIEM
jgi:hypothetical protein